MASKIYLKEGVGRGSVLSLLLLLFFVYVNDVSDPKHYLNSKSQFTDDTGLWARRKRQPWQHKDYRRTWMHWRDGAPNGG